MAHPLPNKVFLSLSPRLSPQNIYLKRKPGIGARPFYSQTWTVSVQYAAGSVCNTCVSPLTLVHSQFLYSVVLNFMYVCTWKPNWVICNDCMHINRSDFHCAALMLAVLIYSQCYSPKQTFMDQLEQSVSGCSDCCHNTCMACSVSPYNVLYFSSTQLQMK